MCKELFRDNTPEPDQYDLSLPRVAPDQWCAEQRFRKGLALVSRFWWEPATRALYEHVILRRVDQIAAFARTLRIPAEDAGVDFGAMVRRITLHECVVVFPECNIVDEAASPSRSYPSIVVPTVWTSPPIATTVSIRAGRA